MLEENISEFFNANEFAITASLPTGDALCIFDQEFLESDFGAEGRRFSALFDSAAIAQLSHYDTVVISEQTYEVIGIRPMDDGKLTEVILKNETS